MPAGLIIGIEYTQPPGVAARKWSDFTKAANQVVADTWHGKYLPRHFGPQAQRRYHLARRARSTVKKKERLAERGRVRHGGRRKLVHSGLLEEQVTRRGILRVFPKRFTLTMPAHIPRKPRRSSIDLHDEVTRTTGPEERYLGRQWEGSIHAQLAAYKPRRRVRV